MGQRRVCPPDSLPHWLTVIPMGSNSTAVSPTPRFPRQQFRRGLHGAAVRGCPREVSLSVHRSAVRREPADRDRTPAASAILATEFSQFLCKGLRSISFSLVSVAAVGLRSGDEVNKAYATFILNQPPNFETHFILNFFTMYFPIPLTAFFSEFLFYLPILKSRESSSLHPFWLFCLFVCLI